MSRNQSGNKQRQKGRSKVRKKASPKSPASVKPTTTENTDSTTSSLQERAYQGKKRGPKFRASGDDEPVDRLIPVPAQRTDNLARKHTKHSAGALRRLGVTPESMQRVPRVSHILEQAEGGLPTVIAALRLCDDTEAQKFLDRYDRISPSDLQYLSLEQICVASQVEPKRLLELAVSSLVEDGRSAGAIIAATYHPRVIRATAQSAMMWSGESDRRLFLQGTGFLPQPSKSAGGGVFVNITNQQASQVQIPPSGEGEPVDSGPRFGAAEDDLIRLHEHIDGNRLLEAPKTVESPTNVILGHQYREMAEAAEELDCIPNPKS